MVEGKEIAGELYVPCKLRNVAYKVDKIFISNGQIPSTLQSS